GVTRPKQKKAPALDASGAAAAVLDGYAQALKEGDKPFILEESHPNLREMALGAERAPVHFWSKLTKADPVTPSKHIQRLLHRSLPDGSEKIAYSHRI